MVTTAAPSKGNGRPDPFGSQCAPAGPQDADMALLDALPDALLLFDENECLAGANAAFRALFPDLEDLLQEPVAAEFLFAAMSVGLLPTSLQETPGLLDERLARFREPSRIWRQRLADGTVLEIEDRILKDGGRLSRYRDVTRAANESSLLGQRLAAVEAMQDGVIITDPLGNLTYANQALALLLGHADPARLADRPWLQLLSPSSARMLRTEVMPLLPNTQHWRGEVEGAPAGAGSVPLELSMTQLEEGGAIIVVRSLARQKAEAAERARLQEQFFEAQKLEALGNLAGGIAHDFNNIISCISGYATFISEDFAGKPHGAYADSILTAAERAHSLVAQILSFSRRAPTERKRFAPAALMRETASLLRATLSPRISLDLIIADETLETEGDPTQIGQVLMNLAVNARDALPGEKGSIELSLGACGPRSVPASGRRRSSLAVGEPENPPGDTGQWVEIAVRDTGAGIPKDIMHRIFDPFFTTKGEVGGSGLGLAAVHGIVLEHSGALIVSSTPGKGTEFSILLPPAGSITRADDAAGESAGS